MSQLVGDFAPDEGTTRQGRDNGAGSSYVGLIHVKYTTKQSCKLAKKFFKHLHNQTQV